jgi:hypothetical protein
VSGATAEAGGIIRGMSDQGDSIYGDESSITGYGDEGGLPELDHGQQAPELTQEQAAEQAMQAGDRGGHVRARPARAERAASGRAGAARPRPGPRRTG